MSLKSKVLATTALVAALAGPVAADVMLPAPYVSNALDAVLMPVNDDVRDTFMLNYDDEGVLVLSVAPGGVAEAYGILPGDVLQLDGSSDPVYIDEIVYYWIISGIYVFDWDIWRDGGWMIVSTDIDETWYWEGVDITTISTWESWSYESWSYEEYVVSYSEEITMTYESSEMTITEMVSSEEFASEVEETYGDASEEEISDDDMSDEEMADDSAEDMGEDEGGGEEEFADDGGDDAGGDDGGDDAGGDDGGDDAGGDDGGGDDSGE